MRSRFLPCLLLAILLVAIGGVFSSVAQAQCSTCVTPAIAYSPIATPAVATYSAYYAPYPSRWIDRVRMRRYERAAYRAGVAPYSVGYTPYTVGYAPYTAYYTAAYRPYVTSYAPLAAPTSVPACAGCTQTAYYTARRVVLSPVVSASCATCGCDPCSCSPCGCSPCTSCATCTGCSTCSACDTGVGQAVYSEPSSSCPNCVSGAPSSYSSSAASASPPSGTYTGPQTPQPELGSGPSAPGQSVYESKKSVEPGNGPGPGSSLDPVPGDDEDSNTYIEPPLLDAPGDRTARDWNRSSRPTVDVHNAIYRKRVETDQVSHTSKKPAPSRAEVDAVGWSSVAR